MSTCIGTKNATDSFSNKESTLAVVAFSSQGFRKVDYSSNSKNVFHICCHIIALVLSNVDVFVENADRRSYIRNIAS